MKIRVRCSLRISSRSMTTMLFSIGIASCTTTPPSDTTEPARTDQLEVPAPPAVQADSNKTQRNRPPDAARRSKPGPIPTRALNVATECSFRDETGYGGKLKLSIDQARVQTFEAAVDIPRRGICKFNLKNFRQTKELPTVELSHLRDPCVVRVWEQGTRVTVAFQQCRNMCSGNAWDHLWPILNDRQDGSCA